MADNAEPRHKALDSEKTYSEGQNPTQTGGEMPQKGQGPKGPQVATDGGIQPKESSGPYVGR